MGTESNRLEFIDIARGIGIFLVVLAHTFVPEIRRDRVIGVIFIWICSYAMPVYIMISGYLFERGLQKYRKAGFAKFTLRKLQGLMLPYLSVSVISYAGIGLAYLIAPLASVLSSGGYARVGAGAAMFQILTGEGHIDKHLWFLYTLFLITAVSFIFGGLLRRPAGLALTVALFGLTYFLPLPEIVFRVFTLLCYFSFARQTALIEKYVQKKYFPFISLLFAASSVIQIMGLLTWNRPLDAALAIIVGLSGATAVLSVSRMLSGTAAGRAIHALGDYSFVIYLLHQPFIVSGVSGMLLKFTNLPHIAVCAVTLSLGIALPVLADRLVIRKVRPLRGLLLGDFSK